MIRKMMVLVLASLLLTILVACAGGAAVSISKNGSAWLITADGYTAIVASDGHLTNLRVGGMEFLKPGVDASRGSYFVQDGIVDISNVSQPDNTTISAVGNKAAVTYTFKDDGMTWKISNKTSESMPFFAVLDSTVKYAIDSDGKPEIPPFYGAGTASSWIMGKVKINITGSTKFWGPWAYSYQVWEADLSSHETRDITFSFGQVVPMDERKIANMVVGRPADYDGFSLYSPVSCQVFQRQSRYKGLMLISGKSDIKCDSVEYRLVGKPLKGMAPSWTKLSLDPHDFSFFQKVVAPAGGWYELEVRSMLKGKTLCSRTVEKVGVGEVFVIAGQSNSTNCAQFKSKQTTGMVSCFSGKEWEVRDDPFIGTHDQSTGGSAWPSFGDAMFKRFGVPIGVASTGHGGTSVGQWAPGGDLFSWTLTRINQLGPGGFRAVLWHQGESDAFRDPNWYYAGMCRMISGSYVAAKWTFPWFVAHTSYQNQNVTSVADVRSAQKRLWDTGIALEGPDTDTLTGDNRDNDGRGVHMSLKGLKAHGELWAEKVGNYLDKVLDK
jgi:hypothetical protein